MRSRISEIAFRRFLRCGAADLTAAEITVRSLCWMWASPSTSFGNYSRVNELTYPLGDVVGYDYGWSGQYSDDRISRLTNIDVAGGIGYDYIGMGMTAIVDLASADTQLDRYRTNTGAKTVGQYPGFDKFGRVIHQLWAKPAFDYLATPPVANSVPFVQLEYAPKSRAGASLRGVMLPINMLTPPSPGPGRSPVRPNRSQASSVQSARKRIRASAAR